MEKLTNKEEEILRVLWKLKKAFVRDIIAAMPDQDLHYNTVSTIVRHLEEKRYVDHHTFGNTHQYYPVVTREEYRKQFMNMATNRFFDNSYKNVVSFFAREEKISAQELREILEIIEKKEK